jgi:hypothetical protein
MKASLCVQHFGRIEPARIKAELDTRMMPLDAHLKTSTEMQKMQHAQAQHEIDVAETALGMAAAAHMMPK